MKASNVKTLALAAALLATSVLSVQAQIRITEVAPWSSGNSPVAADWFELTNTGSSAVNITGWRMDDNSNSFASSVALSGISNIAAGESVIFLESDTPTTTIATFKSTWFGSNVPAGLQIGSYGSAGLGVGLSTSGDAVNIFTAGNTLIAKVTFGASPTSPFPTFDNQALLNNTAISNLSVVGTNGAFAAAGDALEKGSPGLIPEPSTYALILGVGVMGFAALRRRVSSLA